MLYRGAMQVRSTIEESRGRVAYTIIPLNVLDFYKYGTGVIACEVDGHLIFRQFPAEREGRKRRSGSYKGTT